MTKTTGPVAMLSEAMGPVPFSLATKKYIDEVPCALAEHGLKVTLSQHHRGSDHSKMSISGMDQT